MKTIGLIGGIASGKSAAAAALRELGAAVLDADAAVGQQFANPEVQRLLAERWGPEILDEQGRPRRGAIAARIFDPSSEGEAERLWIEQLLHPRVRGAFEAEIARLAATDCPAAVVDAPLLLEAGWGEICDELVWVDCPEPIRRQRAATRGWPPGEFERREAAQMPIEQKRAHASWTVDSGGTLDELAQQIGQFWSERIATTN